MNGMSCDLTDKPVRPADELFERTRRDICVRADRLFAWLMIAQWVGAVAAAAVVSPRTWIGARGEVHVHLWAAAILGGVIASLPVCLARWNAGAVLTRHVIAVAQMLFGALLIHVTGGRIETHFHVFGSLAILAFYRDWRVLVSGTLVVVVDHLLRGLLYPESVYGVLAASQWRFLEHAGWVVFEDIFLVAASVRGVREMRDIAEQTAALRESEERNRLVVDGALDAVISMNMAGEITAWNAQAQVVFGWTRDEVMGKPLHRVIIPEAFREAHMRGLLRFLSTGAGPVTGKRIEVTAMRKNGQEFPIELSVAPMRVADGWMFSAFLRDISDRKRAERELQESRERFELAVRGSSDGIWDCNIKTGDVYFSPRWFEMLGFRENELPGRFETLIHLVHPDDRDRVKQAIAQADADPSAKYSIEFRVRDKRGNERWILSRGITVRDEQGAPVRMAGCDTDITDRRRAEQQLRLSIARAEAANAELMFQKFAVDQHAIVAITDAGGRITYVNDKFCHTSGYSRDELLGQDHRLLNSGKHPKEFFGGMYRTIAAGQVWNGEMCNRTKGGSLYWVDTTVIPFKDAGGNVTQYVAIRTDITERMRGEDALRASKEAAEAASRAKSEFLANMSHEIRTPMNGVIGMIDLLLGTRLDDRQQRYATVAKSSAGSLLTLINDVLDFSKIEAGKLELDASEFELDQVVEDVVEVFAERAQRKGLELVLNVDPRARAVFKGDADRIRQILVNLINNAVKFTEAGHVMVNVAPDPAAAGDALRFSVSDTGIGIPAERINRLFKSFSQVDASTTRKYGGTGLGLAISKQLAELMGGEMGVDSIEGRGTTFWFVARLPLVRTKDVRPPRVDGLRVLIADASDVVRDALVGQVRSWNAEAVAVPTVADARAALAAGGGAGRPFGIALVDGQFAQEQIDELLRSAGDATAVVLMSEMDALTDPEALANRGFAGQVTKPVRQSALYDAIVRALGNVPGSPPPQPAASTPMNTVNAPAPNVSAGAGRRILLVEDNEVNQMVAVDLIEQSGYRVDVAGNGQVALQFLARNAYDAVLMDCQMPIMDGFECARRIRQDEAARNVSSGDRLPVIALTANALSGDRERCHAAGMDDYVTKPVSAESLLGALARVLNRASVSATPDPAPSDSRPVAARGGAPSGGEPGTRSTGPAGAATSAGVLPLDAEQVLKRCMGKAGFAKQLLEKFRKLSVENVDQLLDAARRPDPAEAERLAHSLKGMAATVAAERVRAVAADMEAAARQGQLAEVEQSIEKLRSEVALCIASLPEVIARIESPAAPVK